MTEQEIVKKAYDIFDSEKGKQVLADLAFICNAERSCVTTNGVQPYDVFFREGQRSVWLHIQNRLRKDK